MYSVQGARKLQKGTSGYFEQFRRIATRYDKLADAYAAFVQLRNITLWLN